MVSMPETLEMKALRPLPARIRLTARAVVVLDENNKVKHAQLVSEIKTEPDYDAALAALK